MKTKTKKKKKFLGGGLGGGERGGGGGGGGGVLRMERRTRLTLLFEQINSMNKSFISFVHCLFFKGILVNPGKTRVLIYSKKSLTSMEKLILIP